MVVWCHYILQIFPQTYLHIHPLFTMERVLHTPELLEMILGALDPKTLLTSATRVCRYWNNVIRDSLVLQRALFLLPERPSTIIQPRANPLLGPHINRLSLTQPGPVDADSLIDARGIFRDEVDKTLQTKATWHKMLVQQPPATRLGIWKIEFSGRGFQHIFEKVDLGSTGGLCMDQLLGLSKQWTEQGYTWSLFWGEHGQGLFDKEKNSLLVLKVGTSLQSSLLELREASHVIVKLTRWST